MVIPDDFSPLSADGARSSSPWTMQEDYVGYHSVLRAGRYGEKRKEDNEYIYFSHYEQKASVKGKLKA